ncbi:MAG: PAS domain S-box protein [Desulfobacula sp.]|jgi:PAS domain S-box-containing protein
MFDPGLNYKIFFDQNPLPSLIFDRETLIIVDVNREAIKHYGYSREEFLSMTVKDLRPPEEIPAMIKGLAMTAAEVRNVPFFRHRKKDGTPIDIMVSARDFNAGERFYRLVTITDITEKRKTEEDLVKSEKKFRMMADLLPQTIFETDLTGRLTYVNKSAYVHFGYTPEDFGAGLNVFSMMAPEDRPVAARNIQELLAGRVIRGNEYRALKKDGSVFPIMIYSSLMEEEGKPVGLRGILIDLTDIRQAEDERVINESKFRAIYDQTSHLAGIVSTGGVLLETNRPAREFIGRDKASFIGKLFWETPWWEHSPETRDLLKSEFQKALKGEFVRFETTHLNRKNELRHIDFSIKPVLDKDGQVFCLIPEGVDITDRKKTEEALRQSEETFRALAENSADTIMRFDRSGRHLYVNPAVQESFKIDKALFLGKTHEELGFPDNLCRLAHKAIQQVFNTGEKHRIEFALPGGAWVDWLLMPEFGNDKEVKAVITSGRDITERKQAEEERGKLQEQLIQAQKMDSIGRLAGGVAHDFNNMLGAIIGYVELGLISAEKNSDLYGYLKQIRNAAFRSADLTRQLLAFARKQTISPKVLDLNKIVAGMLKMIQRLIGEDIELEFRPAGGLWQVNLDPSQVDQLLMNLCVNARDAIAGVGRISIRTGNEIIHENNPGDYVLVEVADNGCGMDEKILSHLFEPFFTTKEMGKGTGLGLATVYGIVQQNKGFIKVESRPGQGALFRIYLPRYRAASGKEEISDMEKPVERGHETILLVEDEPMLLDMTMKMLEQHGYRILAAQNPEDAFRLADTHAGEIDLLITDVVMPGMNGRDLAEKLLSRYPGLRCLFMSGYTSSVIARHGVLDKGVNFIEKPFSLNDLTIKVRQVMDMGDGISE